MIRTVNIIVISANKCHLARIFICFIQHKGEIMQIRNKPIQAWGILYPSLDLTISSRFWKINTVDAITNPVWDKANAIFHITLPAGPNDLFSKFTKWTWVPFCYF